jgi:hypothetical protein
MSFPTLVKTPEARVSISFTERDGSTSELDLTPYADLLLELGEAGPRSEAEMARATAVLGELSASDQIVFVQDGVEVDGDDCLFLIGEGLYRVLSDAVDSRLSADRGPTATARGSSSMVAEVTGVDVKGRSWLSVPDAFWEIGCIAEHERFDLIDLGTGALLLRACPYTEEEFRGAMGGAFHADDPEFCPGSHCGLTKWLCAGCGVGTILETEEEFPAGWLEVDLRREDGDVLAYEAVCSMACLGALAEREPADLRASRIPGFPPQTA